MKNKFNKHYQLIIIGLILIAFRFLLLYHIFKFLYLIFFKETNFDRLLLVLVIGVANMFITKIFNDCDNNLI